MKQAPDRQNGSHQMVLENDLDVFNKLAEGQV